MLEGDNLYKINVFHTHTEINDYNPGDCEPLEKMLSIWDSSTFKLSTIGFSYDEKDRRLRIPRGVELSMLEHWFGVAPNPIYSPDEYDSMSMRITTMPKDDTQRESIAFLIGEGEYRYTQKYSQLLLNLAPGAGKTYITSAAMTFFRMKTLIVMHTNNIKEQWLDTFTNMTDLDPALICVIKNSDHVKRLLKSDKNKYKVYLVTHGTLASYAKRNGWDAVHEFIKHLKIGLKVIDEAHLFFANTMKIDMYSNCKKSIYLTATFERSDYKEQRLFKTCMKNVVRYGEKQVVSTRKHIMYLALMYNSHPTLDEQAYMYTLRKFNKNRYSQYTIRCKKFFDALEYVIEFFSTKAGKMLILTTTIEACGDIRKFVEEKLPYKIIREYHSKIPSNKKEEALDADIICSTSASVGTGTDIPGLRVLINTESYSSRVTADQVSGRLREFNDHDNTYYIELVDTGFKPTRNMYERRLPVFKKKCKKLATLDFDKLKK